MTREERCWTYEVILATPSDVDKLLGRRVTQSGFTNRRWRYRYQPVEWTALMRPDHAVVESAKLMNKPYLLRKRADG